MNQDGEKVYLWYHTTAKWRLSKGIRFQTKSNRCWMSIYSDGEFLLFNAHLKTIKEYDVTKIQQIWRESDLTGSNFPWTASVAISSGNTNKLY